MATWKAGDRVQIIEREVTGEDLLTNAYFGHLANLSGTITSVFSEDEIAVKVDSEAFDPLLQKVHTVATKRMRAKFMDQLGEEQKRKLSAEEKAFDVNYMVLVKGKDLKAGPKPQPKVKSAVVADEDEEYDGTNVKQGVLYDDPSVPNNPARKSAKELEEAEEEELNRRRN